MGAANTALWETRAAPPGSAVWQRARQAVARAIRNREPLRQALRTYIFFLGQAAMRSPPEEARTAIDFRYLAQDDLRATSDQLVEQLERLARIPTGH